MEKIIKGMANASEAIDNNFEELNQSKTSHDTRLTTVEQNIELLDFSDSLNTITGVTNLTALKVGRLHMITFTYKPVETGFTIGVISGMPAEYRPANHISGSVSTVQSTSDSPLGISAVLRETGVVNVVAPSVPTYEMIFSFVWIA